MRLYLFCPKEEAMRKIMVIGSPGSGKSTFSRGLKAVTGLPLFHLDQLYHRSDRTTISREEFDAQLQALCRQPSWIIDGNYQRTLDIRIKACDTVFLLDYPPEVCLAGALSRVGQRRDDLPWIETALDEDFKQAILDFPQKQLPMIYDLLERHQAQKHIVIFRSREEAEDYLISLT